MEQVAYSCRHCCLRFPPLAIPIPVVCSHRISSDQCERPLPPPPMVTGSAAPTGSGWARKLLFFIGQGSPFVLIRQCNPRSIRGVKGHRGLPPRRLCFQRRRGPHSVGPALHRRADTRSKRNAKAVTRGPRVCTRRRRFKKSFALPGSREPFLFFQGSTRLLRKTQPGGGWNSHWTNVTPAHSDHCLPCG